MRKFQLLVCLFITVSSFVFAEYKRSDVVKNPTFELLTGAFNERSQKWKRFSSKDRNDIEFYETNYMENIGRLQVDAQTELRIPKVLHFIWVGPKSFPEESVANVQSWKELHPDWKIIFWTDSVDRPCPVDGMEKHLVDEISFMTLKPYLSKTTNYAEMADIIRYELLYTVGGVYVDHDVYCLRPFDMLNYAFDFYAALEDPHTNSGSDARIFPCNCLFGIRPRHPILKEAIRQVDLRWEEIGNRYPGIDPKSTFQRVINRTFRSFTLAIEQYLSVDGNCDMVFPSSYFFPDKIFNRTTKMELLDKGFVYASHSFASTWRDKKHSASKKQKSKSKKSGSKK